MLVTRQCDTGRSTWSSSKLGALHQNPVSLRMSNLGPLTTQPDWREQYSQYLSPTENNILSPHFNEPISPHPSHTPTSGRQFCSRPALGHRHSVALLDNRQDATPIPGIERPDSAPGSCRQRVSDDVEREPDTIAELAHPVPTTSLSPPSPSGMSNTETPINQERDMQHEVKDRDEEEEEDDDDEMLDTDDPSGHPQTDAERRAERRKMKRFRLTHQQTRFLMSEFAKQAHPDATHRERLSREIPGLSPRQVQVWFQNRRAKIKRLTADDRERMMKMRAVPDDFDNVQALHSPYGAVHGIGTPLVSPVDYASSYADHNLTRPLVVDTLSRRHENDEHLSPTGISPAFGNVGFSPAGSMSTPDLLSPLSLAPTDRYYSSHLSAPLSAGPRSANPFSRQSSDGYQIRPQARHQPRPLQPLSLRETISRSRSESLQSPLRSSMSWKGNSLDYTDYSGGPSSPSLTGRQQSTYQQDQPCGSPLNPHQYESNQYSSSTVHNSQSQVTYPSSQQPLQPTSPHGPRYRSSSVAFLPNLDLGNEYRTISSQQSGSHGPHTTPRSNSFASGISSGSFQSAPLIAPADFQLPRTPVDASSREYHIGQMNTPIPSPQEFTSAYSQNPSPARSTHQELAIHGPPQQHRQQQASAQGASQEQRTEDTSGFLKGGDYEAIHKRKRTYSMPGAFQS